MIACALPPLKDLATILIALGVAFVAFQQFFLAREKFKLDLFERRFTILTAVKDYLEDAIVARDVPHQRMRKFLEDTQTASFLFDDDIVKFLNEIEMKGKDLATLVDMIASGDHIGADQKMLSNKRIAILHYFMDTSLRLKDVFAPYLKFKAWHKGFLSDY